MNSKTPLRCVFFGTSDFAVPSLRALSTSSSVQIVGVVTQPDKPVGRSQKLQASAVKIEAEILGLPIFQPTRLKDFFVEFESLKPDVGVVVSYGKIIPQNYIDLPRYKIVNIHASLLPRFRGASPIQQTILAGDTETGISIMVIDAGMDTGPLLLQKRIPVGPAMTTGSLFDVLAPLGADALLEALPQYIAGSLSPLPQSTIGVTLAPMLHKSDGMLDFHKTAQELERQVRAFSPWPGTFFLLSGAPIKVYAAHVDGSLKGNYEIGILQSQDNNIFVQTTSGVLVLDTLQPAGKKPQSAAEFLNGHRALMGQIVNDTKNR